MRGICQAGWAIWKTPIVPACHELLIERFGYHILNYRLTAKGTCPKCDAALPGRWAEKFDGQIADLPYLPRRARK